MTPTYHERMVCGQGDASGLRAVDSAAGRIGQLVCWEHYNQLARYALMADGEQIHWRCTPARLEATSFLNFLNRSKSILAGTRWRLDALSSAQPHGWMPINR